MAKYIGRHRRARPQRPVSATNPAAVESNTRKTDEREPALAGG